MQMLTQRGQQTMMKGEAGWTRMMAFLNLKVEEGQDKRFVSLAHEALEEFSDAADYIWKIPKLQSLVAEVLSRSDNNKGLNRRSH